MAESVGAPVPSSEASGPRVSEIAQRNANDFKPVIAVVDRLIKPDIRSGNAPPFAFDTMPPDFLMRFRSAGLFADVSGNVPMARDPKRDPGKRSADDKVFAFAPLGKKDVPLFVIAQKDEKGRTYLERLSTRFGEDGQVAFERPKDPFLPPTKEAVTEWLSGFVEVPQELLEGPNWRVTQYGDYGEVKEPLVYVGDQTIGDKRWHVEGSRFGDVVVQVIHLPKTPEEAVASN